MLVVATTTNRDFRNGIADEELARRETERGRKRDRQGKDLENSPEAKRLRSNSSASSISVETISTSSCRSPSADGLRSSPDPGMSSSVGLTTKQEGKRRRHSRSSAESSLSNIVHGQHEQSTNSRRSQRNIGDASPRDRGRRRSRTQSQERQSTRSSDEYRQLYPSKRGHREFPEEDRHARGNGSGRQQTDRQSRAQSPIQRGRLEVPTPTDIEPGQVILERHQRERSVGSQNLPRKRYSQVDSRHGTRVKNDENTRAVPQRRETPKERSLSPFSKRIALTQSMNMDR